MRGRVELRFPKKINLEMNGLPPKTAQIIKGLLKPKISKLEYTVGEITH